jgi:hypothetical protein
MSKTAGPDRPVRWLQCQFVRVPELSHWTLFPRPPSGAPRPVGVPACRQLSEPLPDWRDCDSAPPRSTARLAGPNRQTPPRAIPALARGANIHSCPLASPMLQARQRGQHHSSRHHKFRHCSRPCDRPCTRVCLLRLLRRSESTFECAMTICAATEFRLVTGLAHGLLHLYRPARAPVTPPERSESTA